MSSDAVSYPPDAGASTFLLTVRGKTVSATLEETRKVHNDTAGAPPSVAGARSLGDLSHNVFAPASDELRGELLFIDFWNSLAGLGQFFSNPQVQAAAGQLFGSRDATVWAPAEGFGDFHLLVPSGQAVTGLGVLRAQVTGLDKAADAFTAYAAATINRSRMQGIVSHSTWTRVPGPGEELTPEIVSIDLWTDPGEMNRYYDLGVGFEHLGPVFAGQPQTSAWMAAPGEWVEW